VAGLLEPDEDAALRAHLATCAACRGFYDELVLSTRALTGKAEATGADLAREEAQLLRALGAAREPTRPHRRWLLVPATALAVLVAVVALRREPDIIERGADDAVAPFSVSLYARAKSGTTPVRLVGQFPESGEATVSPEEWLQVKAPPDVVVVVVLEKAEPRRLEPGASESLPAGAARVFAVKAPADEVLRAAREVTPTTRRLSLNAPQVTGVLSVRP
jgi:hypothetical protein